MKWSEMLEGDMNRLTIEKRVQIISILVEGGGINAACRITGVSKNAVLRELAHVGTACSAYQDRVMRNLTCQKVQCDEIWSFVGKKQKNVPKQQRGQGIGDVYTWVAIDADTKLIPSFLVGNRDVWAARDFIKDLASRLANRIQLTTDGLKTYINAVDAAFGTNIDYSMLVKLYSYPLGSKEERRYSSGECCGTIKGTVMGNPDEKHVSTSFVERSNLTMRMHMRRFTRLTNGFSKRVENHAHAVSLHFMFYNFCKIHSSLRITPAMQARIDDHVWSLEEVIMMSDTNV